MLSYTPPPHMDAKAMIERAAAQLRAWHAKYGEHQPGWLPPAGDVQWLEDAGAFLAAHTLPLPDVECWERGLPDSIDRAMAAEARERKSVPREPTAAMLEVVREKPHPTRPDGWADRHASMWRRMWDAAPGGPQG